jgi:S-adenosylmethionine hydrolase
MSEPEENFPAVRERGNEMVGSIVYSDGFGNLITNIDSASYQGWVRRFRGFRVSVRIGRSAPITIRETYGEADAGDALATFGSFDRLEIAVREGSAARHFCAGPGALVTIRAVRR